jgi:hypothetical protein
MMHPFNEHIQLLASSMTGPTSNLSGALLIIADVILAQSDSRIICVNPQLCAQHRPSVQAKALAR